jgi:hypothetical protein
MRLRFAQVQTVDPGFQVQGGETPRPQPFLVAEPRPVQRSAAIVTSAGATPVAVARTVILAGSIPDRTIATARP